MWLLLSAAVPDVVFVRRASNNAIVGKRSTTVSSLDGWFISPEARGVILPYFVLVRPMPLGCRRLFAMTSGPNCSIV